MRRVSTLTFVRNISRILAHLSDEIALRAWEAVSDLIMPHVLALPDDTDLRDARVDLLISMVFRQSASSAQSPNKQDDPFAAPSLFAGAAARAHVELIDAVSNTDQPSSDKQRAVGRWCMAIRKREEQKVISVLQAELSGKSSVLASDGIEAFIEVSAVRIVL